MKKTLKKDQNKQYLLTGDINKSLVNLALPIMGTSFVEMAYNLIDMVWIGNLGGYQVSAVGTAGLFVWVMFSLSYIPRIGGEVLISQAIGRGDEQKRQGYMVTALLLGFLLAVGYTLFLFGLRRPLVGLFRLQPTVVETMTVDYLGIVSLFMLFPMLNMVMTSIFNAHGNSRLPFRLNVMGMLVNIVLDPLLIFGYFGFPELGIRGAACATVLAQMTVSLSFAVCAKRTPAVFGIRWWKQEKRFWENTYLKEIIKTGFPMALQNGLFALIAMGMSRVMTRWGAVPIGVQRVTAQIESLSWRTTGGFATALTTFMGQNYGAGQWERAKKGYSLAARYSVYIGVVATGLFVVWPEGIIRIFFHEPEAIAIGINCLRIMGYSQIMMCLEIISSGAFNAIGKTNIPSTVGITFNGLRIPLALILSADSLLGLDGVWWSITISSVFKGIILFVWFRRGYYHRLAVD